MSLLKSSYICARCLRASRRTSIVVPPLSTTQNVRNRQYRIQSVTATLSSNRRITAPSKPVVSSHRDLTTSAFRPHPATDLTQSSPTSILPPTSSTATTAVLNPRQDEDDLPMTIEITARANRRLQEIMTRDSDPDLLLRYTVESGGCHGFQYLQSLTTSSEVDADDDTVFVAGEAEAGKDWIESAKGKAKVVMDGASLELLKGTRIDFARELIGDRWIVDNPRASSSCGCGTSFDIKI